MVRPSTSALIAGSLLLVVLLIGGYALRPRTTDASLLPSQKANASTVQHGTPTPDTKPQESSPTSSPSPTPTIPPLPTATPAPTLVPTDTPPSSDLGASLDRYLDSLLSAELFHGAVLVARNGEIILAKGYGSSNYDDFTPNTAHTRFRLASVTKQFTALAIMQLAAEGKLRIEDSICGYIDQCPQHWQSITLRHLLQHTSGIPNYTDFLDYELTQMDPATPLQLVDRFRDQNLLFTPGEGYSYGNSGYVLLGVVIERVSGQSYREYLRQHIFEPLGMVDTGVAYDPEPGSPIAKGYQYYATNTRPIDTSTLFSAGAMYASVQDLYLWDQALYTEKLLPKPFLDQIFAPGRSQYGFGWKITEQRGHIRASHSGEMDGCRTALLRYPNDQITVIVLSNMLYADVDAIAAYIGQIVLNS